MHSNSDIIFGIPWVPCVAAVLKQNLRNIFWERNNLFKSLHYIKPPIVILEKNTLTNFLLSGSHRYKTNYKCRHIKINNHLQSYSHFPKKKNYLPNWKPFKNDEKCFLFRLKSSFCPQDIFKFLSWLFGHFEKAAWLDR